MKIRLIQIRFQNELPFHKIEAFRGAVVSELKEKDILFHNHKPDGGGLRYSYPLIQYKRINKKATILCVETGTESIGKFFQDSDLVLNIHGETSKFEIESIKAYNQIVQIWEHRFSYRIRKWLALNQENYEKFERLESVAEKSLFLENILKANTLSFAKGLNIFFDKQIECKITWLSEPTLTRYKNVKMTLFDAEFITNVSIPDYVGLGKGVSIGYGMTVRKRERKI